MRLKGKVAIVTGGAQGIGEAAARAYDGLGTEAATVHVAGVDTEGARLE